MSAPPTPGLHHIARWYLDIAASARAAARSSRTRSRVLAGMAVACGAAVPVAGVTVLGAQLGMLAAYLAYASRDCATEARLCAREAGAARAAAHRSARESPP